MESWIRYSVAVYVGLLLAGAAMYTNDVQLGPAASADTGWYYAPANPEALLTPPAVPSLAPPHSSDAQVTRKQITPHDDLK